MLSDEELMDRQKDKLTDGPEYRLISQMINFVLYKTKNFIVTKNIR